jgi:DMSO/TMAO reductase YedYZ molybdopterin-dependent catalytic subunit
VRWKMLLLVLGLALAACGSPATGVAPNGEQAAGDGSWVSLPAAADCAAPITVPTLPAVIPGYTEVDPSTGLHVTGTPVEVDPVTWRLEVTGLVEHPLSLTYDEVRCLPKVQAAPVLDCPGYFQDEALWAGVPLAEVLGRAGVLAGATGVRLVAADGYTFEVELTPETLQTAFLAYELNGDTLPVLHGFPLRFVWPGHEGWNWVKWLIGIEVY